jgi:16S rRNA processing protein RimM
MSRRAGERLIQIAAIAGAHGVRGDVRVKSFTAVPEACFSYGPFLSDRAQTLLEAVKWREARDHYIVTPKHPRQKEEWDGLKGTGLFVPRAALPPPEDSDEFYHADLIGLPVYLDGHVVGEVRAVQDFGAGDLLDISYAGRRVFLPFTKAVVPVVDLAGGRIELGDVADWLAEPKPGTGGEDAG